MPGSADQLGSAWSSLAAFATRMHQLPELLGYRSGFPMLAEVFDNCYWQGAQRVSWLALLQAAFAARHTRSVGGLPRFGGGARLSSFWSTNSALLLLSPPGDLHLPLSRVAWLWPVVAVPVVSSYRCRHGQWRCERSTFVPGGPYRQRPGCAPAVLLRRTVFLLLCIRHRSTLLGGAQPTAVGAH